MHISGNRALRFNPKYKYNRVSCERFAIRDKPSHLPLVIHKNGHLSLVHQRCTGLKLGLYLFIRLCFKKVKGDSLFNMIDRDEFDNIQVGDYIQIVDRWNSWSNANDCGCMDYLLGKTFPVSIEATTESVAQNGISFLDGTTLLRIRDKVINSRYWSLNMFCIEKVIKNQNIKPITDTSLERILNV